MKTVEENEDFKKWVEKGWRKGEGNRGGGNEGDVDGSRRTEGGARRRSGRR